MKFKRICLILIILVLNFPSLCLSFISNPTQFSKGLLNRDDVIEQAKAIHREKYPDADVVNVDSHKWVAYRKDGTYVEWFESYIKILTEKGKRDSKTISSYFTIPYNTTQFILAEIIKEDSQIIPINIETKSSTMIENEQMEANIFNPNSKIVKISLPELEIGDMVHTIIYDDFVKAHVSGTWSDITSLETTDPIKRLEYTIVAPAAKPLKKILLKSEIIGTVTHSISKENDKIIYRWIAKDIPKAFPEPEMPPLFSQAQRLLVSTVKDWKEISRWYFALCKPNLEKTTPIMKQTVIDIIKGLKTKEEKIKAIFSWVSQEIRYLGITVETEAPGYEPHPVSLTFERRAGVCRDKAALLCALLNLAGFESYPVLMMNGPKKDPEVPLPFFNHAIACVREGKGTYLLMDPTDENTKQFLPAYLNNQSYLVAKPEGETLRISPSEAPEDNMMSVETKAVLDKSFNLKAESILKFEGINDNAYRGFFSRMSAIEQKAFFEKIIKKISSEAQLKEYSLIPENLLNTGTSLEAKIKFEAKNFCISGDNDLLLPMMQIGRNVGMVHYLIGQMGLIQRKYPIITHYACGVKETTTLKFNPSIMVLSSLPKFENIDDDQTKWVCEFNLNGNILTAQSEFQLKLPEYSPQQYLTIRDTLQKIESNKRKMPVFSVLKERKSGENKEREWYDSFNADAVILDEIVDYEIYDSQTWTEIKNMKLKILTYAGKKKYSDMPVSFNPVWEDVKIEKAVVTSPAGEKKYILDQEINLMDANWVGNAPRYPKEKYLVINFPGIEVGSIIEYTLIKKKKKQPFFYISGDYYPQDPSTNRNHTHRKEVMLPFSINGAFAYHEPIVKKTINLKILYPQNKVPIKILKFDSGTGLESIWKRQIEKTILESISKDTDKTCFQYIAERVKPVPIEEYLPPWYSFNPFLFASAGNWQTYSSEIYQALINAASSQPYAIELAKKIVEKIEDKVKQIITVRDFVATHIQQIPVYIDDLPLDQISPADITLKDGYGNSADRAVVLYAMLKGIGFNPDFVATTLLKGKSKAPEIENLQNPMRDFPSQDWLKEILVSVIIGEKKYFLNDTDQYAYLGSTPSDGNLGLLLKSGTFETIVATESKYQDRDDVKLSIKILDKGSAIIKRTQNYYGNSYAVFNKKVAEMMPEQRRRYHQELVASISQSAKAEGDYITQNDRYPGVEEFSVVANQYAVIQDKYIYLILPELTEGIAGIHRDKRENPLYRNFFARRHIEIDIEFPPNIESLLIKPPDKLILPLIRSGEIILQADNIFKGTDQTPYQRSLPSKFHISQNIELDPVIILPEEYPEVLNIHQNLSHLKNRTVLMNQIQN